MSETITNPFDPVPASTDLVRADDVTGATDLLRAGVSPARSMAFSALSNPLTRLGGGRDRNEAVEVNPPRILREQERIWTFKASGIAQKIVNLYPHEAPWPKWTFGEKRYAASTDAGGSNAMGIKLNRYFEEFTRGRLEDKMREVSIEARLHGSAYLLLGAYDGNDLAEPLNEENIQSFDWVEVLFFDEVQQDEHGDELYYVTLSFTNRAKQLEEDMGQVGAAGIIAQGMQIPVHRSRIIEFGGNKLPESIRRGELNPKHQSSLQTCFNSFQKAMQAQGYALHMLADFTIFTYALQGLQGMIKSGRYDEVMVRMLSMVLHKSVGGGIAHDKENESIDVKSGGSYGGATDLLNSFWGFLVADCDIVRFKLLGTANQSGLGAEGRGVQDRLEHANKLEKWTRIHWKPALLYMMRLALRCKAGPTNGTLPPDYGLIVPATLELSPQEIAELVGKYIESYGKAVETNLLNKAEAREALFAEPGEFPIMPYPTLDVEWTKKLIDQAKNVDLDAPPPAPEAPAPGSDRNGNGKTPVNNGKTKTGSENGNKAPVQNANGRRADDNQPVQRIIHWNGFELGIQYLPLDKRHGKDMLVAYGHVQNTRSADDGMALDVYVNVVGMGLTEDIYEITQLRPDGSVDEKKYFIGVMSAEHAESLYKKHMPPSFFGGVRKVTKEAWNMQRIREDKRVHRADEVDTVGGELSIQQWDAIAAGLTNAEVIEAALAGVDLAAANNQGAAT